MTFCSPSSRWTRTVKLAMSTSNNPVWFIDTLQFLWRGWHAYTLHLLYFTVLLASQGYLSESFGNILFRCMMNIRGIMLYLGFFWWVCFRNSYKGQSWCVDVVVSTVYRTTVPISQQKSNNLPSEHSRCQWWAEFAVINVARVYLSLANPFSI